MYGKANSNITYYSVIIVTMCEKAKVGLFQKQKGKPVIIYFLLFCLPILEARM
jgi:hypothetical protein